MPYSPLFTLVHAVQVNTHHARGVQAGVCARTCPDVRYTCARQCTRTTWTTARQTHDAIADFALVRDAVRDAIYPDHHAPSLAGANFSGPTSIMSANITCASLRREV